MKDRIEKYVPFLSACRRDEGFAYCGGLSLLTSQMINPSTTPRGVMSKLISTSEVDNGSDKHNWFYNNKSLAILGGACVF